MLGLQQDFCRYGYLEPITLPNMGSFKLSQRGLDRYIRCKICSLPPSQQKYIPIKQWCSDNNYTVRECILLLKRGLLYASKYKNRYYVMENPQWQKRL